MAASARAAVTRRSGDGDGLGWMEAAEAARGRRGGGVAAPAALPGVMDAVSATTPSNTGTASRTSRDGC